MNEGHQILGLIERQIANSEGQAQADWRASLAKARRALGLPTRRGRPALDPAAARELLAAGRSATEIAAELGCSVDWVRRIRRSM